MFDLKNSQLPSTATPLARALDILEERLFGLPVQMITKDPWTVDVALLDHLAWEHSVDVWDLGWPEDVKRRVIAASSEVHRFKGTPFAIKAALAAFNVDTELLEWWEEAGVNAGLEVGSFRVTAYAGRALYGYSENTIDTRMLYAMNAVVQRVSPVSRKLIFRLGERFTTGVFVRTDIRPAYVDRAALDPGPRPNEVRGGPMLRTGHRMSRVSTFLHDPAPRPNPSTASTYVRMVARVVCVSVETHDVKRRAMT